MAAARRADEAKRAILIRVGSGKIACTGQRAAGMESGQLGRFRGAGSLCDHPRDRVRGPTMTRHTASPIRTARQVLNC